MLPTRSSTLPAFSPRWWLRRTWIAIGLTSFVAAGVGSLIGALGGSESGLKAAGTALIVLLGAHASSALLTLWLGRLQPHAELDRIAAWRITSICIVVFLAQIAAVGVPEAAQATLKVEADAKPAALVLAAALLWLGGPMLLLFAWLSGLTAVPSCFAMLRSLEADRLRAAEAAKRDAELKLSVLAAQIEPHFLFNTLAGMRGAVLSEPARAVAMIDRLAEYLRLTIPRLRDDGSSQNARLEAQFDIAAAYLGLMQARLPRLHYRLDLPDALRGAAFPPLMLISLVENAVKHGVEPKSGEALITVTAHTPRTTAGELLQVTVSDNGVGFQQGHGGGVGLTNIRARLEQLYGARGSLALEQRPEGGVQAAIQVPLRWADQEVATGMSKEVA